MTVQEYIKSGILEDYSLGLLQPDDQRQVERMCEEHLAVAEALEQIRFTLLQYAGTHKIGRRAALRKSVWKAVKKLWEKNRS